MSYILLFSHFMQFHYIFPGIGKVYACHLIAVQYFILLIMWVFLVICLFGTSESFLIIFVISNDDIKPLIHVIVITFYYGFLNFYFESFETHAKVCCIYTSYLNWAKWDDYILVKPLKEFPLLNAIVKKMLGETREAAQKKTGDWVEENQKRSSIHWSSIHPFIHFSIQLMESPPFFVPNSFV
jgi:hypothetical protein